MKKALMAGPLASLMSNERWPAPPGMSFLACPRRWRLLLDPEPWPQVVDRDHEDDDQALDGGDEVGGHPDHGLHGGAPDEEAAEKIGRQDAPQRVQAPEESHDNPVETVVAGETGQAPVGYHPVGDAPEDEHGAGDPATRTGEGHGAHDRALDGHPGVGGGIAGKADSPDPEAEPGAPQEEVARRRRRRRR